MHNSVEIARVEEFPTSHLWPTSRRFIWPVMIYTSAHEPSAKHDALRIVYAGEVARRAAAYEGQSAFCSWTFAIACQSRKQVHLLVPCKLLGPHVPRQRRECQDTPRPSSFHVAYYMTHGKVGE